MRSRRALAVLVIVAAFLAIVGLLCLLVTAPRLSAPVEAVATVLGSGFAALAAFGALRAAQISRKTTRQALRREQANLGAERMRLDAELLKVEQWHEVAILYGDNARAAALDADRVTAQTRLGEIADRQYEISDELRD